MGKTFITSGTGTEQTISEIESEKIPIYDTEADAEADFANIAEGQLYATKEDKFDVDDMKQYIRNQNILSDWENITLSTNSNNPTVFDKDGFLLIEDVKDNKIHINNEFEVWLGRSQPSGVYNTSNSVTIPVKIGDQIYINTTVSGEGVSKVAYYKLRDYSDR